MPIIEHAVISAAGLGSRLQINMPKCLLQIGGRTILDLQLELLQDIPDVRITVGFMEEAVIKAALSLRRDVTFVRNPQYATTSNAYSINLASEGLDKGFLAVDGDLLIDPQSFSEFLDYYEPDSSLIGIADATTDDAVFVRLDESEQNVISFSRTEKQKFEWAGIAILKDIPVSREGNYLFEEMMPFLPLRAKRINCFEIDTPNDLERARHNWATISTQNTES